jgi:PAS domain S-box-containing protein
MVDALDASTVSKNYVQEILQSIGAAMLVLDANGRVRTVNPAALELLGYAEEELKGRPGSMILGDEVPSGRAGSEASERFFRLRDGREVPVLFSATPLPRGNGQVWLARDISDRKRAERALQEAKQQAESANRAKSELLSRTSHELRTPLNVILGFGQLLEAGDLSEADRVGVQRILKAGRHLLQLINEVLDINGVESGRRTLALQPVNLASCIGEALELIRPVAAAREISIHSDAGAIAGRYVAADRQRLHQVFLNLLSNAVKYNRHGGAIYVEGAELPGGIIRATIRDTGKGITPEGIGRLFVPFERLGVEGEGIEGTGLGLVYARTFVEAMGGALCVSSVPGEGSSFWVDLPRAPEAAEIIDVSSGFLDSLDTAESTGPKRLVYIEDNASNRELIELALLRRPNIELIMAANGLQGVDAAVQHRPDLILTDLHLPDIPGDEVLKRLRREPVTADVPIVILSADATPSEIARLRALGADDYLTKPLDIRNLLRVIDQLLQERTLTA